MSGVGWTEPPRSAGAGFAGAGAGKRSANEQQAAAIAARGQVFVSAGAGTGKTTVLVERFVEAVCERGIDVESMLVITYTERAAGELKGRIRARLHELGRHDLARSLDGAWISTIHGFCLRLLKSHPFAAGLDPRFRVLDDSQGRVIRGEAFEAALNEFCAGDEPDRLQLLATYGAGGLRRMLTTVYETLRSAGRELDLELGERADLQAQLDELAAVARALADDPDATDAARKRRGPGGRARGVGAAARAAARPRRAAGARRARGELRGGAEGASSRRRSTSWRCRTASCCRSSCTASRPSTRRRRTASRRSTSRISSCTPATCSATTRRCASGSGCASARSWSTSSRTRTGSSASSSTC